MKCEHSLIECYYEIPQGSCLGLLLFMTIVSFFIINLHGLVVYTDDIMYIFTNRFIKQVTKSLLTIIPEELLSIITIWIPVHSSMKCYF